MDMLMGFLVALIVIVIWEPGFRMVGVPAPLALLVVLGVLLRGPVLAARLLGNLGGEAGSGAGSADARAPSSSRRCRC